MKEAVKKIYFQLHISLNNGTRTENDILMLGFINTTIRLSLHQSRVEKRSKGALIRSVTDKNEGRLGEKWSLHFSPIIGREREYSKGGVSFLAKPSLIDKNERRGTKRMEAKGRGCDEKAAMVCLSRFCD